ncbi:Glycolipid transfer protein 1 [Ancistrocladus abbreviatus]
MDFLLELFPNLVEHPDWPMAQCCTDSYNKTLKKWHGWLACSSFNVAMKLAPDRKKFMGVLGGDDNIKGDIVEFLAKFSPLLQQNHKFLSCRFRFVVWFDYLCDARVNYQYTLLWNAYLVFLPGVENADDRSKDCIISLLVNLLTDIVP